MGRVITTANAGLPDQSAMYVFLHGSSASPKPNLPVPRGNAPPQKAKLHWRKRNGLLLQTAAFPDLRDALGAQLSQSTKRGLGVLYSNIYQTKSV